MNIDLTRNELERLILLVGRSIMDTPDGHLDGVADKLMAALLDAALLDDEHPAAPVRLWDAGVGEGD
jgi:hypothetical protein